MSWLLPGAKEKRSYCPNESPCDFCRTLMEIGTYATIPENDWSLDSGHEILTMCLDSPEFLKKELKKYEVLQDVISKILPYDSDDDFKKLKEWADVICLCDEFKTIVTKLNSATKSYHFFNKEIDQWGNDPYDSPGDYQDLKEDRREYFHEMNKLMSEAEKKKNEIHEAIVKVASYEEKTPKKRKRQSLVDFLQKKPAYCGDVLRRCSIFSAEDVIKMSEEKWKECEKWIAPFIYEDLESEYRS
jgi:hypothetical protein